MTIPRKFQTHSNSIFATVASGVDSFDYSSLEDSSINAMDKIKDFAQGIDRGKSIL